MVFPPAPPTVFVSPPSDGTYTVEVGRDLDVTCEVNTNGLALPGSEGTEFSVVAFRVGDPEPEPSGTLAN